MSATLRRSPGWRLYLNVLAPSLLVVLLVGGLAISSVKVLGAARAYVGGESMWSKARSDAVRHLHRYADSHDPQAFTRFENALAVPLGDRQARLALMQTPPDRDKAFAGFLIGANHPHDIDGMIAMFVWFGDTIMFKDAMSAWIHGDELIAQLQDRAAILRQLIESNANPQRVDATLQDLDVLNEALRATETRFSASLGVASRLTEGLLMLLLGITTVLLSLGSILLIQRTLKQQAAQQRNLSEANRRWELAVLGSGLGLFELNGTTGQITMDARAASMYGLEPKPVILDRQEISRLIVPEDIAPAEQTIETALRYGELFKINVRTVGQDGKIRHIETTGRQAEITPGLDQCLTGVVRDVTQEKVRAQLAIERDAAERVAESQRAFLSRLSHELRTPLNAILGFAQLLSMDKAYPLVGPQQKQVKWILDAGDQLLNLVEDVLDLSKVETGEVDIQTQPCSPDALLRTSLPLIEGARQRFDVHIINRMTESGPYVVADPKRLLQVFINLLSNGCKYNKPGGHLTIDSRVEGDQVCIEFADDGIGLSEADAAELFQAFRRVPSATINVEGSGLGLYIVKQLVERMNGSVSVCSQLGVGSRFTVRLPLAP